MNSLIGIIFIVVAGFPYLAFAQEAKLGRVADTVKNLKIPEQVKAKILDDYIKAYRSSESVRTGSLVDQDLLSRFKRKALEVKAEVSNVDPVLKSKVFYEFPQGGGVIDFNDLLSDKQGDGRMHIKFHIQYPADVVLDDLSKGFRTKVYFLSNTKEKKQAGLVIGNGCNKFFEITHFFNSTLSGVGALVSTKQDQHLWLFGGAFIFAFFNDDEVYMSSIQFVDSKDQKIQCKII